jgi:hypothetical protein
MHRVFRAAACALAVAVVLTAATAATSAAAASPGVVRFVKRAGPEFDRFTSSPTPAFAEWMQTKMWRSMVFTPYFDNKTSWYKQGWVYEDLYALYKDSSLSTKYANWILRDASGNKMYIPWGCGGGTCPQYAADIGNPDFRRWWIDQTKAAVAHGYKGVWIDDVNMEFRVGNGNGDEVAPMDPRTGKTMTWENWRRYMAEFVEQIRAELPGVEIVHNSIWYAVWGARDSDPYVKRQIAASDYVNLERGVNDDGLTGGSGEWSLKAVHAFVDRVHAAGKGIIYDGYDDSATGREYALANWFLTSNGNDGFGIASVTPETWWDRYDVDLGQAKGARTSWNGLLRRDFDNGMVLVNEPGAPSRTVTLPQPMVNSAGETVSSVTLAARRGTVLCKCATEPEPQPEVEQPQPEQPQPETPQQPEPQPEQPQPEQPQPEQPQPEQPQPEQPQPEQPQPEQPQPEQPQPEQPTTEQPETPTTPTTPSTGGGRTSRRTTPKPKKRRVVVRIERTRRTARSARSTGRKARSARVASARKVWDVHVKGVVQTATSGRVEVRVERRSGRRWVKVTARVSRVACSGAFSTSLKDVKQGSYRVRASYLGASAKTLTRAPLRAFRVAA